MTNTIHAEIFGHGFGLISDNTWAYMGMYLALVFPAKGFWRWPLNYIANFFLRESRYSSKFSLYLTACQEALAIGQEPLDMLCSVAFLLHILTYMRLY